MREHACSALDLSRLVGATLGCALAQDAVDRVRRAMTCPAGLTVRIIPTMTGKDIETDPQPKWLRPIDPLLAAGLPIRIDPRLGVDDDTAYRLQRDAEPLLPSSPYS